ncbi:MAG: hypothetical protein JSS02_20270 [Planctomycetes bacterium]|nr:hypothetical protein [Planctomycetota bacterium]
MTVRSARNIGWLGLFGPAALMLVMAGCRSMSAQPVVTARPAPSPLALPLTAPATTDSFPHEAKKSVPPTTSAVPKPPAESKFPQRGFRPIMPANPDKTDAGKPAEGSLTLPRSEGSAAKDEDDFDSAPPPITRDNQLPRTEAIPKITPGDVTVPQLVELGVYAPLRRKVGTPATFQIAIRNTGDRPQEQLVIRCRFDDTFAFSGSDKQEVRRTLDHLGPGETRDMALTLSSDVVGSHCCWFVVSRLEGAEEVELTSKQVCVDYVVRQVDIEIVGPHQRTEGSRAEFTVNLTNTSDRSIRDARVVVTYDKALLPRELSEGADQRPGQLTWTLGELPSSEQVQLQLEFECRTQAHRACLTVEVQGTNLSNNTDEACVEIVPVRGTLDLRVSDDVDPLPVGKVGKFQITVENIGLQAARRVALEATATENLKIVAAHVRSAGSDVPLSHKLDGNKIVFDLMDQLDPGTHLVYTIEVEALRKGTAEVRASLTSGLSSTPVLTAEPTIIVP